MNDKSDYGEFIALLCAILGLLFIFVLKPHVMDYIFTAWYYMKYPIYKGLAYLPVEYREYISYPISFIYSNSNKILDAAIDLFQNNTFEQLFIMEHRDIKMFEINKLTPFLFAPFVAPIIYIMSKKIINKERFISVYSIESLGIQEAKIWPQIQPVIYDYDKFVNCKSLDEGWFAMSPKPIEFFKKYDLLYYYKNENEDDVDNFGKTRFKINVESMHKHFVEEIGKPWSGIESMSMEKKCILAIILPKLLRNPKLSVKMNNNLSRAYAGAKLIKKGKNTIEDPKHKKEIMKYRALIHKEVEEILLDYFPPKTVETKKFGFVKKQSENKKKMNPLIANVINEHFYEKIIFSVFLDNARKTGVLASCEFLWLKKENRDLWYIMSQTGRTASFCECSGAWSHLLTERKVGRKVATPMVQKAVDAADKYLFETHDNYDPIGDYSED
jgi:hypothetical protein